MNRRIFLFKTLLGAAAFLGASTLFTACSDETKEAVSPTEPTTDDTTPTTDQLGVCYDGKTLLLGDDRTGINASVAARIKNPVSDFSPNLASVVLVNGANVKVRVADVPQLIEAYNNYTNFVVVGGRGNETVAALADTVNKAIDQLDAEGKDTYAYRKFLEGVESARLQLDKDSVDVSSVAGFRKNSSFGSPSLDNAYANSKPEDNDSIMGVEENYKPNGYRYGLSADNLISWMKESEDLDNGGNAEEEAGVYTISRSSVYWRPVPACQVNCDINYKIEIIPLYKFDTDEDYYLMRYLITIKNSQLPDPYTLHQGYHWGKIEPSYTTWYGAKKNYWLGPVLYALHFQAEMFQSKGGNEEVVAYDPQPSTSENCRKEYGFDFTMDNIVPVQPTVTSNASPTYSYKKLWKVQPIENIPITNYLKTSPDSSAVDWFYMGTLPTYKSGSITHVPDYQTNDFTIGFSWITKIKNPKHDVRYKFTPTPVMYYYEVCPDYSDKDCTSIRSLADADDYTRAKDSKTLKGFDMPEPNHSRTSYNIVVDFEDSQQNIKDVDADIQNELGFSSQNPVYSYAKNDAEGQAQAIKAFKQYAEMLKVKTRQYAFLFKANLSLVRTDNNSNETVSTIYVNNME